MIVVVLLAGGVYITEMLIYSIFLQYFLREKIKHWWRGLACIIPYGVMVSLGLPMSFSAMLSVVTALFFMTERIYGKIVVSVVFLDCISEMLSILIHKIPVFEYNAALDSSVILEYVSDFILNVLVLLILLVCMMLIRIDKIKNIHISANVVYVILGIVAWIVLLTIVLMNFLVPYAKERGVVVLVNLFIVLGIVSVFILLFIVLYTYQMSEKLEEAYRTECNLMEAQEAYYHALLEKEEETRKYRHDISNHMMCLLELSKNGKREELLEYIEGMNSQLKNISQRVYDTGNHILDIVLNYYMVEFHNEIKVKVIGRIIQEVDADNLTLCTIFSNIIKNAVEELNRNGEDGDVFRLRVENGDANVKLEVQNSSKPKEIKEGKIKTEKIDRKNHGMGIENVKKAVERCHGIYEFEYKDGMFTTTIYLPYKLNRHKI